LRKSGKKVDIKTAEIWENNAEIWQLIAEFWQLIDFSQFAEIWENVAELWCFPANKYWSKSYYLKQLLGYFDMHLFGETDIK
jgi:hypothetical protein